MIERQAIAVRLLDLRRESLRLLEQRGIVRLILREDGRQRGNARVRGIRRDLAFVLAIAPGDGFARGRRLVDRRVNRRFRLDDNPSDRLV